MASREELLARGRAKLAAFRVETTREETGSTLQPNGVHTFPPSPAPVNETGDSNIDTAFVGTEAPFPAGPAELSRLSSQNQRLSSQILDRSLQPMLLAPADSDTTEVAEMEPSFPQADGHVNVNHEQSDLIQGELTKGAAQEGTLSNLATPQTFRPAEEGAVETNRLSQDELVTPTLTSQGNGASAAQVGLNERFASPTSPFTPLSAFPSNAMFLDLPNTAGGLQQMPEVAEIDESSQHKVSQEVVSSEFYSTHVDEVPTFEAPSSPDAVLLPNPGSDKSPHTSAPAASSLDSFAPGDSTMPSAASQSASQSVESSVPSFPADSVSSLGGLHEMDNSGFQDGLTSESLKAGALDGTSFGKTVSGHTEEPSLGQNFGDTDSVQHSFPFFPRGEHPAFSASSQLDSSYSSAAPPANAFSSQLSSPEQFSPSSPSSRSFNPFMVAPAAGDTMPHDISGVYGEEEQDIQPSLASGMFPVGFEAESHEASQGETVPAAEAAGGLESYGGSHMGGGGTLAGALPPFVSPLPLLPAGGGGGDDKAGASEHINLSGGGAGGDSRGRRESEAEESLAELLRERQQAAALTSTVTRLTQETDNLRQENERLGRVTAALQEDMHGQRGEATELRQDNVALVLDMTLLEEQLEAQTTQLVKEQIRGGAAAGLSQRGWTKAQRHFIGAKARALLRQVEGTVASAAHSLQSHIRPASPPPSPAEAAEAAEAAGALAEKQDSAGGADGAGGADRKGARSELETAWADLNELQEALQEYAMFGGDEEDEDFPPPGSHSGPGAQPAQLAALAGAANAKGSGFGVAADAAVVQLAREKSMLEDELVLERERAESLLQDKALLARRIKEAMDEKSMLLTGLRQSLEMLALENQSLVDRLKESRTTVLLTTPPARAPQRPQQLQQPDGRDEGADEQLEQLPGASSSMGGDSPSSAASGGQEGQASAGGAGRDRKSGQQGAGWPGGGEASVAERAQLLVQERLESILQHAQREARAQAETAGGVAAGVGLAGQDLLTGPRANSIFSANSTVEGHSEEDLNLLRRMSTDASAAGAASLSRDPRSPQAKAFRSALQKQQEGEQKAVHKGLVISILELLWPGFLDEEDEGDEDDMEEEDEDREGSTPKVIREDVLII